LKYIKQHILFTLDSLLTILSNLGSRIHVTSAIRFVTSDML